MNKFNDVFHATRRYCLDPDKDPDRDCFQVISEMAKVPLRNLDFYLNVLRGLDLVKYSWTQRTIQLTPTGEMKEKAFA